MQVLIIYFLKTFNIHLFPTAEFFHLYSEKHKVPADSISFFFFFVELYQRLDVIPINKVKLSFVRIVTVDLY